MCGVVPVNGVVDLKGFNVIERVSEQLTTGNVIALAKCFGYESFLSYFIKNNKSNVLPYHNLYHTFNVINSAFQMYIDYCNPHKSEHNPGGARSLFLACLFHDFGHTGGHVGDKWNIDIAIEGLEEAIKTCVSLREGTDKVVIDFAKILIKETQFPYKQGSDGTFFVDIIRDADMSQIVTDNFLQQNVLGLSKELGIPLDKFIDNQIVFLKGIVFRTEYGKRVWSSCVVDKIKELEELKSIMGISCVL